MAANFLRFCRAGSVDGMAFAVGVLGVECATGEGRMCIRSGEGAAGNEPRGSGLRIDFWGSSTTSFLLPSSVNKGMISSSLLHGP